VPSSFRKHPLAWANVAFILTGYAIFTGIALSMHRRITFPEVMSLWPLHIIFVLNLAVVLGFLRPRQ
jgi:hypothetical protein